MLFNEIPSNAFTVGFGYVPERSPAAAPLGGNEVGMTPAASFAAVTEPSWIFDVVTASSLIFLFVTASSAILF